MGHPVLLRGAVQGRRGALAHHAEGPDLQPDRWHRGRRHDLAARGARGQPKLGLPLLLAPRRHAHPRVADARRLPHRGPRLARLAAARRGGGRLQAPDHVRTGRGAPAGRMGGGLAPGLRGVGSGPDRERRLGAVPARRLRRGHVGPVFVGQGRRGAEPGLLGPAEAAGRVPRDRGGRSPTTASGRCGGRGGTSPTPR